MARVMHDQDGVSLMVLGVMHYKSKVGYYILQ